MEAKELKVGDFVILKSNGVLPDAKAKITELFEDGCFVDVYTEYGIEKCDNLIGFHELEQI